MGLRTDFVDAFGRSNATDVSGFTDAFSQSNEDPLSSSGAWTDSYTGLGTIAVVGNALRTNAGNIAADRDGVETQATVSGAAQYVKFRLKSINNAAAANVSVGAVFRAAASPTRTYYQVNWSKAAGGGSNVRCFKLVAGTATQIGSDVSISNLAASDVLRAQISSQFTISMYVNGTCVAVFQDTSDAIASGRAGVLIYVGPGGAASDIEIDTYEAGVPPASLLGSDWEEAPDGYTDFSLNSNVIQVQIVGTDARNRVAASGYSGDQWGQIMLAAFGANGSLGVGLRDQGQAVDTVYDCYANPGASGGSKIDRRVNASNTNLATESTTTWGVGDKLRADVQGRVIRLWRLPSGGTDWVLLLKTADDQISGGKPAVRSFVSSGAVSATQGDDWQSGSYVTPFGNELRPRIFAPGIAR